LELEVFFRREVVFEFLWGGGVGEVGWLVLVGGVCWSSSLCEGGCIFLRRGGRFLSFFGGGGGFFCLGLGVVFFVFFFLVLLVCWFFFFLEERGG